MKKMFAQSDAESGKTRSAQLIWVATCIGAGVWSWLLWLVVRLSFLGKLPILDALRAAAPVVFGVGVVSLCGAVIAALVSQRLSARHKIELGRVWLELALFSGVVFVLSLIVELGLGRLLSAQELMAVGRLLLAPGIALGAVLGVWSVRRFTPEKLWSRLSWRLSAPLLACVGGGMIALLGRAYPDTVEALALGRFIGLAVFAAVSLLGAIVLQRGALRRAVPVVLWALLLILLPLGLLGRAPSAHALALERREAMLWMFWRPLLSSAGASKVPFKEAAGSATCKPGQAPPVAGSWSAPPDAPDIILVTVDALRWDHTLLGAYKRKTTAHLAAWAKQGRVYSQAFSPATSTRQTFGALFTGVYPSLLNRPQVKRWSLELPKAQESLAGWLSGAGYETSAVVVATNVFDKARGALKGFEHADLEPRQWWDERKYAAPLQVDRVIAALSSPQKKKRPRFIWTHIMEAHQNYHPGPEPASYGKRAQDRYDAAVHFVDSELDRLLQTALSPARRKNTVVILTADHGHAFGEHGQRFHGHSVYEEELHVPLVIWGPGVDAEKVDVPVSTLGVFATILGLSGATPEQLGFACEPSLLGAEPRPDALVYAEQLVDESNSRGGVGLIKGDEKLVVSFVGAAGVVSGGVELFDRRVDRADKHDIAKDKPERAKQLLELMLKHQRERGVDSRALGMEQVRVDKDASGGP